MFSRAFLGLLLAGSTGCASACSSLDFLKYLERNEQERRTIEKDRDGMEAKYLALGPNNEEALLGLGLLIDHDEELRCKLPEPDRAAIDRRILAYTATASKQVGQGGGDPSAEAVASGRARAAIRLRRFDLAEQIGRTMISAPDDEYSILSRGNLWHEGHMIVAETAFAKGDLDGASRMFIAAADAPSSPELASFGPSFPLANKLLAAGKRDVVIEYLERVKKFWEPRTAGEWIDQLSRGETPRDLAWRMRTRSLECEDP